MSEEESASSSELKNEIAFSENKILPWPFEGPIFIREDEGVFNEFGLQGKSEYFIIDNWCYLGTVIADSEGAINNKEIQEVAFDLDIYKILRQFLRNPANEKKIMKERIERKSVTKLLVPHR